MGKNPLTILPIIGLVGGMVILSYLIKEAHCGLYLEPFVLSKA
jgi:hypothetical protein